MRNDVRALELLFRQTPGAFWTTDRELIVTSLIGREPGALGMLADHPIGKTVQQSLGTEDPSDPVIARHLAALSGQSSSVLYPFRSDLYEVRIEPLVDDADQIIGTVGVALNVTDEQRAEHELALSRAMLAEAQALAHVGSWSWNVEKNAISCSDELYRIYDVERARFKNGLESFLRPVLREDVNALRGTLMSALAERRPFSHSYRIRWSDGRIRMLEMRGDVVSDAAGKIERLTGSCWDVTDQWNANRELARASSLLRATLEATADGLLVVDREGKVAIHNSRFSTLWSIPDEVAKSAEDQALLEAVTSQLDDPIGFLQRVNDLYDAPEAQSFDIVRFKDGRVFERYSIPQKVGSDIVGRVWSFRDVTDRERLLRRAEYLADAGRLLASLDIERALDGVARLSVPFVGEACAVDVLSDVAGPRRLLVVERDSNHPIQTELPRAVLAGHALIYDDNSFSCMSVPLPGRTSLYGVLTFVAGRERHYCAADLDLAEELASRIAIAVENAQLYRAAKDALHVREEFLSVAAHEIRGPITSLHLSIQALDREPSASGTMRKLLDVIERDDRQLIRLVDELLDVTRIRSGRLHFDLQQVDLGEVTREVTTVIGPELARSGSSLSVSTSGDLVGLWDRTRLGQVVTNLVSNAIKYGLGKPIEVDARGVSGTATLIVRDHGIGIDPKVHEHIFDPFARAVSARNYGGLGLGLYIVRTIVDGLGGQVSVESALQQGSTFTVVLPKSSS
jgi:signal transduction histidine kinase/PAS domain-containing protein